MHITCRLGEIYSLATQVIPVGCVIVHWMSRWDDRERVKHVTLIRIEFPCDIPTTLCALAISLTLPSSHESVRVACGLYILFRKILFPPFGFFSFCERDRPRRGPPGPGGRAPYGPRGAREAFRGAVFLLVSIGSCHGPALGSL